MRGDSAESTAGARQKPDGLPGILPSHGPVSSAPDSSVDGLALPRCVRTREEREGAGKGEIEGSNNSERWMDWMDG